MASQVMCVKLITLYVKCTVSFMSSVLYRFDFRKYCFSGNLGLLLRENIYLSDISIVEG